MSGVTALGVGAHYGATFQLAKALDREGRPAEARPLWEKVLKMAEGYNDQPNLAIIRERAPRPEAVTFR